MTNSTTVPPPHVLQVACDPRLQSVVRKACAVWSDVLSGHVSLVPWGNGQVINVTVTFRDGVRNFDHPDRVALCKRTSTDLWAVHLERGVKWAISPWQRFWGIGEDALATVAHELGHVFKLPHASDPSWVMHPEIGGSGRLSAREKEHYRNFFLTEVDA